MASPVTIVIVRALGLSGATWFNLVLGSHKEAMAMGPPTRILDLPASQAAHACFLHRERCDLWPPFLQKGDHRGRFFDDLAEFTGKRVFIVNYPPKELIEREISNHGFRVLHLRLVRDGRAALYSRMRHYGSAKPGTAILHIIEWQIRIWDRVDRKMPDDPRVALVVRYEDAVRNPEAELARVGDFIGVRYAPNATRFWEYEHHLAGGNTGVIDLLCRLQGNEGWGHDRSRAYIQLAEDLRHDPDRQFLDEGWVDGLSRQDKLAFDCLLGDRNARLGYPRDQFPSSEREEFWRNLDHLIAEARRIEGAGARRKPRPAGRTARQIVLGWLRPMLKRN